MMDIFTPKLRYFIEQALEIYEKSLEDIIELSCSEYETFYALHFRFNPENDTSEAMLLSASHAVAKIEYESIKLPTTNRLEWLELSQDDKAWLDWQVQERECRRKICALFDIPESLLGTFDPIQHSYRYKAINDASS